MSIKAVIFDLDGVIVSTDEFHYRAWQRLADEEGVSFDRLVNNRLRGVSRMQSLEILLERSARQYSPDEKLALAQRKNGYYRELLKSLAPRDILPGAAEVIAHLRARGVKLAVASSSKNAGEILRRIGLSGAFDATVDGNDITHSKPHPEVFVKAAAALGVLPPQCLVVEDAQAGVEAALAGGMAVLAVGHASCDPRAHAAASDLAGITIEQMLAITAGRKENQ
jgi:beta-phosphoglucomutase